MFTYIFILTNRYLYFYPIQRVNRMKEYAMHQKLHNSYLYFFPHYPTCDISLYIHFLFPPINILEYVFETFFYALILEQYYVQWPTKLSNHLLQSIYCALLFHISREWKLLVFTKLLYLV